MTTRRSRFQILAVDRLGPIIDRRGEFVRRRRWPPAAGPTCRWTARRTPGAGATGSGPRPAPGAAAQAAVVVPPRGRGGGGDVRPVCDRPWRGGDGLMFDGYVRPSLDPAVIGLGCSPRAATQVAQRQRMVAEERSDPDRGVPGGPPVLSRVRETRLDDDTAAGTPAQVCTVPQPGAIGAPLATCSPTTGVPLMTSNQPAPLDRRAFDAAAHGRPAARAQREQARRVRHGRPPGAPMPTRGTIGYTRWAAMELPALPVPPDLVLPVRGFFDYQRRGRRLHGHLDSAQPPTFRRLCSERPLRPGRDAGGT